MIILIWIIIVNVNPSKKLNKMILNDQNCSNNSLDNYDLNYVQFNRKKSAIQHSNFRCQNSKLLILIHSALEHWENRAVIREYFYRTKFFWSMLFLVGQTNNQTIQSAINQEFNTYKDVLQIGFIDSYRNLTLKHLSGLIWTIDNCREVKFVLKMDDDIFINFYLLNNYLSSFLRKYTSNINSTIICHRMDKVKAIRDKCSKWYVTENEYEPEFYPTYCSGWAYLATIDAIQQLIANIVNNKLFWIDDVYVTGILLEPNISMISINWLFNLDAQKLFQWIGTKINWPFLFSNTNGNVKLLKNSFHWNYHLYQE